jgi:hypothetical protein
MPYLRLFGIVAGGYLLARGTVAAARGSSAIGAGAAFYVARIATARFFAEHILNQAPALLQTIRDGATSVLSFAEDQF